MFYQVSILTAYLDLQGKCVEKSRIAEVVVYMSMSGYEMDGLKVLIADIWENGAYPFALDIQILRDVDRALYGKDFVITSDSIILDHCASWANLTAECVGRKGKQGIWVWSEERNNKDTEN